MPIEMLSKDITTRKCFDQIYNYLLHEHNSKNILKMPTTSPKKHSIRISKKDEQICREKYDGRTWRLVCTWNESVCTNFAVSYKLCPKHKKQMRSRTASINHNNDTLEIHHELNENNIIHQDKNHTMKPDFNHFKQFSIDSDNDDLFFEKIKLEPQSIINKKSIRSNEIEYIGSKTCTNNLNVSEFIEKNLPPLTDFEEDCIANHLIEKFPKQCLMLDAQVHLHKEAMAVVKRNYGIQMPTISSDYFYDFLLRHPRIAIHFKQWFLHCKPIPPRTGCVIDTKMWTLGMMVRGSLSFDETDND